MIVPGKQRSYQRTIVGSTTGLSSYPAFCLECLLRKVIYTEQRLRLGCYGVLERVSGRVRLGR